MRESLKNRAQDNCERWENLYNRTKDARDEASNLIVRIADVQERIKETWEAIHDHTNMVGQAAQEGREFYQRRQIKIEDFQGTEDASLPDIDHPGTFSGLLNEKTYFQNPYPLHHTLDLSEITRRLREAANISVEIPKQKAFYEKDWWGRESKTFPLSEEIFTPDTIESRPDTVEPEGIRRERREGDSREKEND